MDIKTRIDALSEAEAKAALKNIVYSISVLQPCKAGAKRYCPHWSNCKIVHGGLCDNVWLDYALKEARDKNFYYPGLPNGDVTTVGNTGDYALKEARK